MKIMIANGANLNYLGKREPDIYGKKTLASLNQTLITYGKELNLEVICYQTNCEGELLDSLYNGLEENVRGIVLNAGAWTHTSIALRDCIQAIEIPVVEIHISNIYAREEFRHKSLISPVTIGQISGFGVYSYAMALLALKDILSRKNTL